VLLYCDGNFMHYLEGAEDAVVHTFARIRRSGLHRHVNELMNLHIVEREFPDWYLGFSRTSATEFLAVAAARWKGSAQTGPGAGLLRSFWSSCRSKCVRFAVVALRAHGAFVAKFSPHPIRGAGRLIRARVCPMGRMSSRHSGLDRSSRRAGQSCPHKA